MTNVSSSVEKLTLRKFLFNTAVEALKKEGWRVERIARAGKSSVRRISKGGVSKTVSIRTTQDTWIAFPRNEADDAWATLADVDYVVAASVDDRINPRFARIHFISGDEMRARFDRAYAARKAANHTIPIGRGVWVSLYEKEASDPVSYVGAGVGLDRRLEIARVPIDPGSVIQTEARDEVEADEQESDSPGSDAAPKVVPLTIAQAKLGLALFLGVDVNDIKITVSS